MNNDIIKEEINILFKEGNELLKNFSLEIVMEYQIWYSKAQRIVKNILPDRLYDFENQYDIKNGTLTIHGYFTCIDSIDEILENKEERAIKCFSVQLGILKSCLDMVDYKLKNIKDLIQADLFDY